jgi:DNA-binding SARP family transcriptional activator
VHRLRTFGGLYLESDGVRRGDLDGQQQILALLAVLASAGGRGVSRATVARIFWPQRVKGSDRTALSTALYRLRGFLGTEVVDGTETLSLNPASISCDLVEFETFIAGREFKHAAELYEGEFLQGFSLRAAESFNQWAEEQRARLALECRHALEALVSAANERGDAAVAITWLRRLVKHGPHGPAALKRLEQALAESARSVTVPAPAPALPSAAVAAPSTTAAAPTAAYPQIGRPASTRSRWRGGARMTALYASLAVALPAVYFGVRAVESPVRILEPAEEDTVDVRTMVTVSSRYEDHWLWIRTMGGCFLRGPFKHEEGAKYRLLAQFGQDGTRQSGYPYWFVVLAEPKIPPLLRVEDRRMEDCRYELMDPEAWSDTVLVYRR